MTDDSCRDDASAPDAGSWSPLSTRVRALILDRIEGGSLPPGSQVVETRVAREFGVSQQTVREALGELVHVGIVGNLPHHGSWVREPSVEEIEASVCMRAEVGALAALRVAQTRSGELLRRLRFLMPRIDSMGWDGDLTNRDLSHWEFHRAIVDAAGNECLDRLCEILDPFLRLHLRRQSRESGPRQHELHSMTITALERQEPERAAALERTCLRGSVKPGPLVALPAHHGLRRGPALEGGVGQDRGGTASFPAE